VVEINTKAPGKLYVAGEYAVVEPGYSAIVTTVDLFIHLKITSTDKDYGTIYSEGFTDEPVRWQHTNGKLQLKQTRPSLKYILSAIHTTENYLQALGVSLNHFHMNIGSELDNQTGKKLGLGSSGAVTVATIQGLLEYYDVSISNLLIYKLSVLAQLELGINSSFGDLAAITYTGWIRYTSFDRDAVSQHLKTHSIKETVAYDWPYLEIKRLDVPDDVHFLIGWTGRPASSDHLVGAVQDKKEQSGKQYDFFLKESQASVLNLSTALITNDEVGIFQAINRNRQALLQMGQDTNVLIETPQLTELCEIAAKYQGAAKTSGAGGGDSGIAFIFNEDDVPKVIREWETANITHLPLAIYQKVNT